MLNTGKLLLTISTISWGLAPIGADWGPSHVFHVDWPPHARLHAVWLLTTGATLAVLSIGLVWLPSREKRANLRVAGIIGLLMLIGFFAALALAGTYGGSISDPDHEALVFGINRNLVILTVTLVIQAIGTFLVVRADLPRKEIT